MSAVVVVPPSSVAENAPRGLPMNPFVGLRPFEAEDSLLFFGRREQSSELLRRLHETRFLAVVGSSGCGKSSLVRAGLIPVLQAGFLVEERDVWLIGKMKPGDAPLTNLALALEPGAVPSEYIDGKVRAIREGGVKTILSDLTRRLAEQDGNLLLLVDQFEEIFRFDRTGGGSEDAADFVSIMLALAEQRELPVYVIMTMRSDFLGYCDTFCGLPEALNRSQYLVPRLRREQRREAIEGPIRLYRQEIAARLTDRLLNETIDTRDDLPVLQHALMRTWDHWQRHDGRGPIDFPHYDEIGTIHHALSKDAEAALTGMDERQLLLTKRVFQALTTVDSGNRRIRRPAKLGEIAARCETAPEEIRLIIDRFRSDGRSFLVVSTERAGADPLIDISHESLIRQWGTLGTWVEEEAESVKTYRRLAESERLYRKRPERYRDQELQMALEWQAKESPNPAWARDMPENFEATMAFLASAKAVRDREWAEAVFERSWGYVRAAIIGIVLFVFMFPLVTEYQGIFWEKTSAFVEDEHKAYNRGAEEVQIPADVEKKVDELTAGVDRKKIVVIFLVIIEHLGLYFGLALPTKWAYRKWAFPTVIDAVSKVTSDPMVAVQPKLMVKVMQKLKKSVPGVIERIAKWTSILVGFSLLTTCTFSGLAMGFSGWFYVVIGFVTSTFLVGWVFAVARLNAEVEDIRTRLEQTLQKED